jgi:hypothetical protein
LGGEDTELTYALKLIGGKLHYSSLMTFKHFMPANRINWEYLNKLWLSFGCSGYIISPYTSFFNHKKAPNRLKLFLKKSKSLLGLIFRKYKYRLIIGDVRLLEIQRTKGMLKALLFNHHSFEENVKMIERLDSKLSKEK